MVSQSAARIDRDMEERDSHRLRPCLVRNSSEFHQQTETIMKILTLIIKKQWFDAILSGEKTVETREVRPTNTKYISYRDNNTGRMYKKDTDVPESAWDSDKGVDTVVNSYDAIRFWVGYAPNRPGALVEVKGAELVEIRDEETKEPIVY